MIRQPSKVYVGLTEVPLVAGVELNLLLLNVGFSLFFLFAFKTGWFLPLSWIAHQAMKAMTRRDPFMRAMYIVYARQGDRYEPWPEIAPRRGLRLIGWGRGRL